MLLWDSSLCLPVDVLLGSELRRSERDEARMSKNGACLSSGGWSTWTCSCYMDGIFNGKLAGKPDWTFSPPMSKRPTKRARPSCSIGEILWLLLLSKGGWSCKLWALKLPATNTVLGIDGEYCFCTRSAFWLECGFYPWELRFQQREFSYCP